MVVVSSVNVHNTGVCYADLLDFLCITKTLCRSAPAPCWHMTYQLRYLPEQMTPSVITNGTSPSVWWYLLASAFQALLVMVVLNRHNVKMTLQISGLYHYPQMMAILSSKVTSCCTIMGANDPCDSSKLHHFSHGVWTEPSLISFGDWSWGETSCI